LANRTLSRNHALHRMVHRLSNNETDLQSNRSAHVLHGKLVVLMKI
jgi:hypothetical protein